MGKPGPPPTPTKVLAMRGSWRAKRNPAEPQPARDRPRCPRWLDAHAKAAWKQLVPQLVAMGVLTRADKNALTRYCRLWSRWRQAEEFLQQRGDSFLVKDAQGQVKGVRAYADALIARETPEGLQLIDGHLRAETTPDQEVPVLVLDVDEAEAEKLLAVIDPLAGLAGVDEAALESLLGDIETDHSGLRGLLDSLTASTPHDGATAPDDVPEPPEEPVAKPGELWLLGKHRLLCGDSTNPADVARLMDGNKAALFQTDPPYLVDYTGADRPNGSGKDWSDCYHEVDIEDAAGFFAALFANALEVTRPDAAWYCWHAHKRAAEIEAVWAKLGVLNHQQIVWVKPTALHTYAMWPWRHEPCLMGWRKGHKPAHDGDNSHSQTTVWEVDWEGKARIVGNEHPTQKPVALFERPMLKHTKTGAVCFEPFSGSGSQIIAAERLGRRCFALEIEPRFVDVAVRRWEGFAGKQARRVHT